MQLLHDSLKKAFRQSSPATLSVLADKLSSPDSSLAHRASPRQLFFVPQCQRLAKKVAIEPSFLIDGAEGSC
jgi:hypothetical protein